VLALGSEQRRTVCNIGTGTQTSVAEFARMLIEIVGVDVGPHFGPRDVLVARREADIRRAAEVLRWETGAKEGLTEVVAETVARQTG
jgi:UDP-glucose 4-epimerase